MALFSAWRTAGSASSSRDSLGVPTGSYGINAELFAGGVLVARTNSALEVIKTGFEQYVADAARDHGLLYGMATALMALLIGWFASVVFARD